MLAYLPALEVAPKVGKGGSEPVIDTMQGQLLVRNFHDRLKSRHGVRGERLGSTELEVQEQLG